MLQNNNGDGDRDVVDAVDGRCDDEMFLHSALLYALKLEPHTFWWLGKRETIRGSTQNPNSKATSEGKVASR